MDGGLDYWTTGMDQWTGVDGGLDYWTGGLDYWNGSVDYWTGALERAHVHIASFYATLTSRL